MKRIYFDNAATTPLDPLVFEEMRPYFFEKFGNPSSVYSYGRETRLAIENARKTVARAINAHPSEIFFTSGGTESSNTAIHAATRDLGCKHIISSPIEHHATLHTIEYLAATEEASLSYVKIDHEGRIEMEDLEKQLKESAGKCLVTLMHGNNEIGTITDIEKVSVLCDKYEAVFHSDTVQTIAHFPLDVNNFKIHFLSGSGHKFHGPKGIGLLYINRNVRVHPYILGGSQERNMRAGTENVYGIVGFAKALQLAVDRMEEDRHRIREVREYMRARLEEEINGVTFNGVTDGSGLYTVLSAGFPVSEKTDMLLFNLDLHHICASGGSACSSGAVTGSHVMNALPGHQEQETVRFSFSRYNTKDEVDETIRVLKTIL